MANIRVIDLKAREDYRNGLLLENKLLTKVNGITILENMLKNGRSIPECCFNQKESLDLILKYKRYDLLSDVTIKNLLRIDKKKNNITYLESILELSKEDSRINRSFLDPFDTLASLPDIAKFYIIYAKKNMQDYLPYLSEEALKRVEGDPILQTMTDNKNLLYFLLEDKENVKEVKEKLLSKNNIKDLEIILTLNERDKEYKASIDMEDDYSLKYLIKENSDWKSVYYSLRPQEQFLLGQLRNVMNRRCSKSIITLTMYSYIDQLKNGDNRSACYEIKRLIDIFNNDKTFNIVEGDQSYFSMSENVISIANMSIGSLNHEMGHMFLHKLSQGEPDPIFYDMLENIKNKKGVLDKVFDLTKYFNSFNNSINKMAVDFYKKEAKRDLSPRNEQRIRQKLLKTKKELMDEYIKKGYDKEVLAEVLNRSYTLEEYKRQHRIIQINMLKESIKRQKLGPIVFISDIVDAIYKGEYYAEKLSTTNEIKIDPISGHGLFYYNNSKQRIFDEIFANYCALRKCINDKATYYIDSEKGPINKPVECLRMIVGDELVDYLEEYYQKEVIKTREYTESRRLR